MIYILTISQLLIIGVVLYIAFRHKNYYTNAISFKSSMDLTDLPIVTFLVDDNKFNFLLDTGSTMCYINTSSLKGMVLKTNGKLADITGVGGTFPALNMVLNLSFRTEDFEADFYGMDLDDAFNQVKKDTGVTIHGILGNDFFIKYKYIIDFEKLIATKR